MRLVYNVYDDDNQIESKQFDNFPKALEYAKQGLITYICEEDLDCPDCEEVVVWTWDSSWNDEEAIANVTQKECAPDKVECEEPFLDDNIEITISGPSKEVKNLVELVFDDAFDLDWDAPVENVKVDAPECVDEFGLEEEPAIKDLDFDVDNPFEDDLYYSKEDEEETDLEIGEPEIIETSEEKFDDSELAMSDEEVEKVNEPFEENEPNGEETVKDESKKVELIEGTGFFSLFDDLAEKLFLEKWSDILNEHFRSKINLLRLRVKRNSGSNTYQGSDYITNFRILSSEVWTYGTEPKLIFKLSAVDLDEKNRRITKPYIKIDLNILLDDLATVDKATGAIRPKSRIAASKYYDLVCNWDYTSIEFTRWTSKEFRDLLTQLVEEQKELKQSTDGRNTKVKAAKKLAQFSQEEIDIAKNWFRDHIEKIEFNVVSGSPRNISNDDFDIEREQVHKINNIHIKDIDNAIEEAILERQKKFFDDYNITHIKPSLNNMESIKLGTDIYLNWRRAEEDVQKHLPYYITDFFNTCKIYFDTQIRNAPQEVVNILTDAVYGSDRTTRNLDGSRRVLQNSLAGEMIINQLFNSDLNFLSNRLVASFDRKSKTIITEDSNERRSDFPFEFYHNDYYTTRYEVCETGTNEKLEEFELRLSDAVDYAKQHLDKKPYIIEVRYYVEAETENGVVDEEEIVWKYDEAEDIDLCGHCDKPFKKTELFYNYKGRKLPVCKWCKDKDLFQDVEKPEWAKRSFQPGASGYRNTYGENLSNESLVENPVYYHVFEVRSGKTNKVLEKIKYTLTDAIKFAKDHLEEEPFIRDCLYEKESNEKVDDEVVWTAKDNIDDEICFYCGKNASKADLKKVGVRDEHVKLCPSCNWLLATRRLTLRDIADRLPSNMYSENPNRITFQPGVYGNTYEESLREGLNNAEFAEYMQLCKEIGINGTKDLESFLKEVGLEAGCDPHTVLDALRDWRKELGPDFKIANEELKDSKKMTKDELLDKEGTADVDLINAGRPEDERVELDEGRQPVYSNVIFYCYDQNDDEQTYTKANMTPIMIRTEVDELVRNGAARVYVEAKIDGEWEALDKYTYDPVWTPGTPEYAARNGKDFALALESLDQEDDLTDQEFAEQLQKRLQESQSQEISREYDRLSKKYGINFEDLVYGEEGFMKTKYPNSFPDFAGDVIYSEKYWNELVEFAKEKGIELTEKLEEIYYPGGNADSSYERLDWDVERDFIDKYERNRKANWRKALGSSSGGNITSWTGRDNSGSSANTREGYQDWEDLPSIREVLVDTDGGYYVLIKMGGTNLSEKQVEMILDCCFPDLEINYEFNKNKIYFRLKNEKQLLA